MQYVSLFASSALCDMDIALASPMYRTYSACLSGALYPGFNRFTQSPRAVVMFRTFSAIFMNQGKKFRDEGYSRINSKSGQKNGYPAEI
jgi:hypothetical protein